MKFVISWSFFLKCSLQNARNVIKFQSFMYVNGALSIFCDFIRYFLEIQAVEWLKFL